MSVIKIADGSDIDAVIVTCERKFVQRENGNPLLNGKWHLQRFGVRAEYLQIAMAVKYSVLMDLYTYSDDKTMLEVQNLNYVKRGYIKGLPEDTPEVDDDTDPYYTVTCELVVMENV